MHELSSYNAHCDGILIPKYPFKSIGEAKSFLQDNLINVEYLIVSKRDGYLWTRPLDNTLDLRDLVYRLTESSR